LLEPPLALEDYLTVDAGMAWNDDEDARIPVEALVFLKLEVNPGEAGVVCTFTQEWNRLAQADLIVDDFAKTVVGIVEAILVLSAAFNAICHGRTARTSREIPEPSRRATTASAAGR
jgi:hypothetical protein